MVQKEFGDEAELLPPRRFKFAESGREAKMEIEFQRELASTGWILALESDSKVWNGDGM